jgi:hypothetical protein
VAAVEAVIAHCRSGSAVQKMGHHKLPRAGDFSTPTASIVELGMDPLVKNRLTKKIRRV